jgi:hypothetical protein
MMKKGAVTFLMVFTLAVQAGAVPNFTVSVNNTGSTTLHQITLSPGDAFSVDLNVTTDEALLDIGARFEASASGVFDITGGLYHSPWDVATIAIPVGDVDPLSGFLAGSPGFGNTAGLGASKLATLDLLVDSSFSLGTHTINVRDVRSSVDLMIPAFYIGDSGPDFVVNVVPEPATFLFLALGVFGIRARRSKYNK